MKTKRASLVMSEKMHDELKKQSSENGMSMSSYVAHLLLMEKQKQQSMAMMMENLKQMNSKQGQEQMQLGLDFMSQLVQNKGDE